MFLLKIIFMCDFYEGNFQLFTRGGIWKISMENMSKRNKDDSSYKVLLLLLLFYENFTWLFCFKH